MEGIGKKKIKQIAVAQEKQLWQLTLKIRDTFKSHSFRTPWENDSRG